MTAEKQFSFSEYCEIASMREDDFQPLGVTVTQGQGEGSTYTYKDNESSVLGIAHLDTVQNGSYSSIIKCKGDRVLLSPRLDDRLGVYIITRLLPKLGIKCDWLLTTGEESGCSSAELFKTDKNYNWSFSFDRAGTDVVLYQHDHKALRKVLRKNKFRVGHGTFSDISSLEIGCSGINFGCGYENPHSANAYAILSDTFRMVNLFKSFWGKFHDKRLPYDPRAVADTWSYRPYRSTWWKPSRSNNGYHPEGETWSHMGKEGYLSRKDTLDWYEVEAGDMAQCDYCGNYSYDIDYDGIAHSCSDCDVSNRIARFENNGR